ncbi:unnamed protein product, partial [Aureobasidium vineae]
SRHSIYYAKHRDERNRRRREKYHNDPEYRQKLLDERKAFHADRYKDVEWYRLSEYARVKRSQDQRLADHALRQQHNARTSKQQRQRRQTDPQLGFYQGLHTWYMYHKHRFHEYVWEHWQPIVYPEKVERACAACTHTRINGIRLWFERKRHSDSDPVLYDCFQCYSKSKWSKIAPLRASGKSRFYRPSNPAILAMLEAREKE